MNKPLPIPNLRITDKLLSTILTKGCGLPRRKALLLGLKYPPKRGWKKKVIGREISKELLRELIIR